MRVIEPRQYPVKKVSERSKQLSRQQRLLLGGLIIFMGLGLLAWWMDRHPNTSLVGLVTNEQRQQTREEAREKTIQTFTAEQFKNLYNTFAYPNIQEITTPPTITGDITADKRIQEIAEKRGYTLRSVPVAPISKTNEKNLEGDDLLQPLALSGWQDLKQAAQAANVPLRLLSAYRSIEYQRTLFVQRLYAAGAYSTDIGNGLADSKVEKVLTTTAPPGYSRHHTGYTIDLACYPGGGFMEFKRSPCFEWLKANNYLVAKQAGWIPSYPEGTGEQGPEPESWEYVWVGTDTVKD